MIGRSIAHFEITAKIGEGGMGEVYQATDTKLNRKVALKILPESFAQDPQRMGRFQREAQVLASLNHPNIAAIHGLEDADEQKALVMELVEGEDLSERIARGPIPVDEALPIAFQIAEALEDAHEKGIVHRDLKPANIKLTPEGKVKILDFGLAKALEKEPTQMEKADSPTLSLAATQEGVILGTAAYMSPEQVRGQVVDKRADIWAYGCVLFEMLSGEQIHTGGTVSDVLARVLERHPNWNNLPNETPRAVRYLLGRCLEKEQRRRLRDIGEAVVLLEDLEGGWPGPAETPSAELSSRQLGWAPIALLCITVAIATWILSFYLASPAAPGQLLKTDLAVPRLQSDRTLPPLISPDGRKVFYAGQEKFWVRDLTQHKAKEILQGASGGDSGYPCWSPDSRSIAIVSQGKIIRTDLETGREFVIAPRPADLLGSGGCAWVPDGRILLVGGSSGVTEVSAQGGDPEVVLKLGQDETDFHEIGLLPEGRGFIVTVHRVQKGADSIAVFDGLTRKWVLQAEGEHFASPAYSPSGHILYARTTTNPGVWAVPFSLESLEPTGDPFLVHPEPAIPSVSANGTLLLAPFHEGRSQLVWVNRGGEILDTVGDLREGVPPFKLSPNNGRLLVEKDSDVWVEDLVRKTQTLLSSTIEVELPGPWLSDDEPLVWVISQSQIRSQPLANRSPRLPQISGDNPSISADSRYIVFERFSDETLTDLWYVDLTTGTDPNPFLQTTDQEYNPAVSPDGRLVAYQSDESGQSEIYIQSFPDGVERWVVSSGGGSRPRWSPTGSELYFVQGVEMVSVAVTFGPQMSLGERNVLFNAGANRLLASLNFEVAADGSRFLVAQLELDTTHAPNLLLVHNWFEEFREE